MTAPLIGDQLLALTVDQLEDGIHGAIQARDFGAAHGYLLLLDLKDPDRAVQFRAGLKAALGLARRAEAAVAAGGAS